MKSAPVIIPGLNQQPTDPEVPELVKRRKHTAAYATAKLRILQAADACAEQGQIGAELA